jgi:tRNA pseudouridine38-40 synthase
VPRYRLTLEYAGTRYSGWQIQKNARTVQGELDRAVRTVTGRHDFELYGSGRTDAGVHAIGQVAHLDMATTLPPATLVVRLNEELPSDINVLAAAQAPHRFHARHSAVARRYVYQIARRRTAFAKPYVWWVREPLDVAAMRESAAAFVGMKDFQSFAATGARDREADEPDGSDGSERAEGRSTLVLVDRLEIREEGDLLLVAIQGSHFLWKMVRRIVGVLVEIGRGGLTPGAARALLTARSDLPARLTAPASGLFLERVFYKGEPLDVPVRVPTPLGSSTPDRRTPSEVPSTSRTTSV